MTGATERMAVQVTASQKKAISAAARRLRLNVSELLRQAAHSYQPKQDERDLEQLAERVTASAKEANDALGEAMDFVRASNMRSAVMAKEER